MTNKINVPDLGTNTAVDINYFLLARQRVGLYQLGFFWWGGNDLALTFAKTFVSWKLMYTQSPARSCRLVMTRFDQNYTRCEPVDRMLPGGRGEGAAEVWRIGTFGARGWWLFVLLLYTLRPLDLNDAHILSRQTSLWQADNNSTTADYILMIWSCDHW